jgi:branched-chain amino acid transport system permease protein
MTPQDTTLSNDSLADRSEHRHIKSRRRMATLAGPGVAAVGLGWVYFGYARTGPYELDVTLLAVVYAILALGLYVPLVMGGHLDLAYNAYFAIGAYAVAIIGTRTDLPVLLGIPLGIAIAALLACVVAAATSHLSGFHLAIATLLVGIAVFRWVATSESITGGTIGIGGIPAAAVFGYELGRDQIVAAGLIITWLTAVALTGFRKGMVGTALRLQRESTVAAESYGIPTRVLQAVSMAIGAGIASIAGGLFALMNQFILAESFTITIVFVILFLPIVGGIASPWGAVIGAGLLTLVEQSSFLGDGSSELVFGLATLAILLVAPRGLLSIAGSLSASVKRLAGAGHD